jgi:hypothetical protein
LQLISTVYEWKILLEWGSVCFCSPSIHLKIFKFFDLDMQVWHGIRPTCMDIANYVRPKGQRGFDSHAKPKIHRNGKHVFVYTHHTMWKRTYIGFQLDGGWPYLATEKRHTHLLNSEGVTHSLGYEKHESTTFWFKNNKYIMKILKRPHGPLNYTNTHSKVQKYP